MIYIICDKNSGLNVYVRSVEPDTTFVYTTRLNQAARFDSIDSLRTALSNWAGHSSENRVESTNECVRVVSTLYGRTLVEFESAILTPEMERQGLIESVMDV